MAESSSRPIPAASTACFRGGKLLLVRRALPPQYWSLPGGRIEPGESAAEAALRELLEETGIKAEIVGLAGHRDVHLRAADGELKRHFVVLSFAAHWTAGEIALSPELSDGRWIEPGEVGQFETTEGLEEIVANARKLAGF